MELSFAQQSVAFGWSFALGAGLGVLYGLLRFLRFSFSLGKTAVFALDLLFMLTWATAAFFFSLAFLRGFVRFYVFIGSLGGFYNFVDLFLGVTAGFGKQNLGAVNHRSFNL